MSSETFPSILGDYLQAHKEQYCKKLVYVWVDGKAVLKEV